jgi:hypothetical protein
MSEDLAGWLDEAKPAETSVQVCLRGDLLADFTRLEEQLAELDRPGNETAASLAGDGRARLAEEIEAVRQQMLAASREFKLRALPRRRWTALVAEHAPREGNEVDAARGVNISTFLAAIIRECTYDPALTAAQWDRLLDDVFNDAQFDELANAAWTVNRRTVDVPFSRAASRIRSNSVTG